MPYKNDLSVDGDEEHGYTVYRLVRVNNRESRKGSPIGAIRRQADGTYEPSGVGAMFGYPTPATTLSDALEAFVGWD